MYLQLKYFTKYNLIDVKKYIYKAIYQNIYIL